jgi:3-hydroxypropanoate dehydrogenase
MASVYALGPIDATLCCCRVLSWAPERRIAVCRAVTPRRPGRPMLKARNTTWRDPMSTRLDAAALSQLIVDARTHNKWQPRDVPDAVLMELVDLVKMGPTSVNCSPARIVFVKSKEAKERLRPLLAPGNVDKTMSAPVTAIIGHDMAFYDHLPKLFPHMDVRGWFAGKPEHIGMTAFRNGTLQGGYLILMARALGLDTGGMSGFDNAKVDAEFFAGTEIKSNFLCNLGYGDPTGVFPRSPRFSFDEMAKII